MKLMSYMETMKMKEGKTRTTIDVDFELWSFVKQEATAKRRKVSEIIEEILCERYKNRYAKAIREVLKE